MRVKAEHLVSFAMAIDVPLIYVMKLDAIGALDYTSVFYMAINYEYQKLKKESNLSKSELNREIANHFDCYIPSIICARRRYGDLKRKK